MQAILTQYVGPENHRGARIVAHCDAGSATLAYDHAESAERNHHLAAMELASQLDWLDDGYTLVSGTLHNGDGVHVAVPRSA